MFFLSKQYHPVLNEGYVVQAQAQVSQLIAAHGDCCAQYDFNQGKCTVLCEVIAKVSILNINVGISVCSEYSRIA